ncbi:agmatine deiminase family protein [Streptomyces tanashiensis]|uniref:agmatine deiminase family protein n=1 Tax=Streptomyces tanashiensis TaxID=67367 RepID=UPI0036E8AB08
MDTPTTSRRRLLQLGATAVPLAALGSVLPAVARAATSPSGATPRMPAEITRIRGRGTSFLSSYTNYYTPNGAVLVPQFGHDEADVAASAILQAAYPGRTVVQLDIDNIAWGGGGIHCATQSQPAVPPVL